MKVDIKPLNKSDYDELYKLVRVVEPFKGFQFYDQFCQGMSLRSGFTFWVEDNLAGVISFSDYLPGLSVMIHATFYPEYKTAMSRKALRHVFSYAFNKLLVERVGSFSIPDLTDGMGKFLERIGFKKEGCLRRAVEISQDFYDLVIYGMLKEDCRWI
jgi:RimJ/RimL family protein N-acetyltransferase